MEADEIQAEIAKRKKRSGLQSGITAETLRLVVVNSPGCGEVE